MDEDVVSTADLLTAWRDATRAAELADRLAQLASEAAETADRSAMASEDIAKMAERAAKAADRAAVSARAAAKRAADFAAATRTSRLRDADEVVSRAKAEEAAARDAYHRSETTARARHGHDGSDQQTRPGAPPPG
jgi:hypothetical protein